MDINVLFSFWMRISGLEQDIEYGNDQCQFFMTLVYMLIVLTRNCIQDDNCMVPKFQELSDSSRNIPLLLPIKAAEELLSITKWEDRGAVSQSTLDSTCKTF